MSFEDQRESFDPETLAVLEKAFNAAWRELEATGLANVNPVSARKALGERIINLARHGHRDPVTLQNLALRSLSLGGRTVH